MDLKQQEKIMVWKRNDGDTQTLEVLQFQAADHGFSVKSLVSGLLYGYPVLIEYNVEIDKSWRVTQLRLNSLLKDGKSIVLKSGPHTKWYDETNHEIPELKGCVDIDISLTPFTNTLPIKRLGNALLKRTEITVLYLNLTDWKFKKVQQYYTKLSNNRYKYEGIFRNFVAELPVDDFGFVTTYPGLFERLYTKAKKTNNKDV